MFATGQSRRFGDVSDWSAYASFAVELVRCNELTRCGQDLTSAAGQWESLWQPRLAKQCQQPLVILIPRESKHESRYYTLDAEVGPLREAILHSCTRFFGPV